MLWTFHRLETREGHETRKNEEMAQFACAAGLRKGLWDGLGR